MNIKRFVILGLCMALALSFSCFAVDYDAYYYQNEDGSYGHDTEAYEHDLAAEMVAQAGLNLNVDQYWKVDPNATVASMYYFDYDAFKADYDALLPEPEPEPDPEPVPDPYPVEWPEEEVIEDEVISDLPLDETILENTESYPVLELPESDLDDSDFVDYVYVVNDLRTDTGNNSDIPGQGLKAVIRSIFGEYTPNMTTTAVTETVDGEVITSLIDTVADGTAGVDWEYISGVFLFGLMLFCLFKLLGGVLS